MRAILLLVLIAVCTRVQAIKVRAIHRSRNSAETAKANLDLTSVTENQDVVDMYQVNNVQRGVSKTVEESRDLTQNLAHVLKDEIETVTENQDVVETYQVNNVQRGVSKTVEESKDLTQNLAHVLKDEIETLNAVESHNVNNDQDGINKVIEVSRDKKHVLSTDNNITIETGSVNNIRNGVRRVAQEISGDASENIAQTQKEHLDHDLLLTRRKFSSIGDQYPVRPINNDQDHIRRVIQETGASQNLEKVQSEQLDRGMLLTQSQSHPIEEQNSYEFDLIDNFQGGISDAGEKNLNLEQVHERLFDHDPYYNPSSIEERIFMKSDLTNKVQDRISETVKEKSEDDEHQNDVLLDLLKNIQHGVGTVEGPSGLQQHIHYNQHFFYKNKPALKWHQDTNIIPAPHINDLVQELCEKSNKNILAVWKTVARYLGLANGYSIKNVIEVNKLFTIIKTFVALSKKKSFKRMSLDRILEIIGDSLRHRQIEESSSREIVMNPEKINKSDERLDGTEPGELEKNLDSSERNSERSSKFIYIEKNGFNIPGVNYSKILRPPTPNGPNAEMYYNFDYFERPEYPVERPSAFHSDSDVYISNASEETPSESGNVFVRTRVINPKQPFIGTVDSSRDGHKTLLKTYNTSKERFTVVVTDPGESKPTSNKNLRPFILTSPYDIGSTHHSNSIEVTFPGTPFPDDEEYTLPMIPLGTTDSDEIPISDAVGIDATVTRYITNFVVSTLPKLLRRYSGCENSQHIQLVASLKLMVNLLENLNCSNGIFL